MADATQETELIHYVLERLATNADKAAQGRPANDFAELYFLKYALDGLVRIRRFDVAERFEYRSGDIELRRGRLEVAFQLRRRLGKSLD